MSTTGKILLGLGGAAIVALVAYYFYMKRERTFDDNGNTKWLSGGGDDKLALQMTKDNHGIKSGDKIDIQFTGTIGGDMKGALVTDVFTDKGFSWVSINEPAMAPGDKTPGTIKINS